MLAESAEEVQVASLRFRDQLPANPTWNDLIEAANRIRMELGISQATWGQACLELSRVGSALCVLITDQACFREQNPVQQPAA